MDRAAPSSSPSSPHVGRNRTEASTAGPPTPRRFCSMDDVMRRTRAVDAPPPVAREASTAEPPTPRCFCSIDDVMRRARAVDAPPPVARAAPSSSPSSPQLGRNRTEASTAVPQTPRRYCSIDDVMRRAREVDAPPPVARERVYTYYQNLRCENCESGDRDDELLLCDRCDRGHHTFCLRPISATVPNGNWFCPVCAPPATAPKSFPLKKTKIFNFFGIQNDEQDAQVANSRLSQDARRRRKHSLVMHKKSRRILPFVPSEDGGRRLKQMASLATALTSSKAEFSNELTYMPNMAPRSSNLARLEVGGMQVLPKEDKECIELCRTMQQRGEFPPLLVVFDSLEGFTVHADGKIEDMTFLAEYAGDVDYLASRANDDFDCIMTLLLPADASQGLVVCPDKRGNISRFFSGINNHTPDGKKKQNVKCVRYDIDGESHVLLVACRDIACGEKLYCDYNGYEDAYPTHHFM